MLVEPAQHAASAPATSPNYTRHAAKTTPCWRQRRLSYATRARSCHRSGNTA